MKKIMVCMFCALFSTLIYAGSADYDYLNDGFHCGGQGLAFGIMQQVCPESSGCSNAASTIKLKTINSYSEPDGSITLTSYDPNTYDKDTKTYTTSYDSNIGCSGSNWRNLSDNKAGFCANVCKGTDIG